LADDNPSFLHAVLCQVGLPRNPTDARTFERTSGSASLRLEAGTWFDGRRWQEMPLPSGTRPRLTLYHVCSEAVRTKSREVEVEHSTTAFLRRLGIAKGGANLAQFKRQMLALAACRMHLGYRTDARLVNVKFDPIEQFEAWLQTGEDQIGMWPGVLTLSGPFFDTLREHAVPLDPGAIAQLQNSALALDTYTWLAHRLPRIKKAGGITLTWHALKGQFGQEYRSEKDFKRELWAAVQKAAAVYPAARLDKVRGGLHLYPSAPPIERQRVVVTLPSPAPAAALPAPAAPAAPRYITEDALDQVRTIAPGWDRQWLLAKYKDWRAGKPEPQDPDKAFLGWVRKFTKGKPPE
jgi:hypothetical protein